jgi:hypothetical protein
VLQETRSERIQANRNNSDCPVNVATSPLLLTTDDVNSAAPLTARSG